MTTTIESPAFLRGDARAKAWRPIEEPQRPDYSRLQRDAAVAIGGLFVGFVGGYWLAFHAAMNVVAARSWPS